MTAGSPVTIRMGAFEGFRDIMWEYGKNPDIIFRDAGIDVQTLDAPDTKIPVNTFRKALNLAADATGQPRFGLLLSQRQSFGKFGAIGYLAKHAPTLENMFCELGQYLKIHDAGSTSEYTIEDDVALWTMRNEALTATPITQHTELGVGLVVKLIRRAVSASWSPQAVFFEHGQPENKTVYSRIFRCPVYFDQAVSGLEFPASDMALPLSTSDPILYEIIKSYLGNLEAGAGNDFVSTVRRTIKRTMEDGRPTLEDTATQLGLNRSQLQRRLKHAGTSFQDLFQEVRHGVACKYLSGTDLPLAAISSIVGFAEPAVFSRAFKRRTGQTPRDWRQEKRLGMGL